jgi:hypothetical protein
VFRSAPSAVPAVAVEPASPVEPDDLVPLSHLQLDLPQPVEGWPTFLGLRGVVIRPDDLGRDSVSHGDARRLLDERRADELRKQRHLAVVEQEAIEADRLWRASLPRGVPVSGIPEGATYGDVVRQAELEALPRRRSLVEESLGGDTMVFHPIQGEAS